MEAPETKDKGWEGRKQFQGTMKDCLSLLLYGVLGSVDEHPNKSLLEDLLHSLKILLGTNHREGQHKIELNNKLLDEEHQSVEKVTEASSMMLPA